MRWLLNERDATRIKRGFILRTRGWLLSASVEAASEESPRQKADHFRLAALICAKRGREGKRKLFVRSPPSSIFLSVLLPAFPMAPPTESDLYAYSLFQKEKAHLSKEILTAPVVGRSSVANHMQLVRSLPSSFHLLVLLLHLSSPHGPLFHSLRWLQRISRALPSRWFIST